MVRPTLPHVAHLPVPLLPLTTCKNVLFYSYSREILIFPVLPHSNHKSASCLHTNHGVYSWRCCRQNDFRCIHLIFTEQKFVTEFRCAAIWDWNCPDSIPVKVQRNFEIKAQVQGQSWCLKQLVRAFSLVLTQLLDRKSSTEEDNSVPCFWGVGWGFLWLWNFSC